MYKCNVFQILIRNNFDHQYTDLLFLSVWQLPGQLDIIVTMVNDKWHCFIIKHWYHYIMVYVSFFLIVDKITRFPVNGYLRHLSMEYFIHNFRVRERVQASWGSRGHCPLFRETRSVPWRYIFKQYNDVVVHTGMKVQSIAGIEKNFTRVSGRI